MHRRYLSMYSFCTLFLNLFKNSEVSETMFFTMFSLVLLPDCVSFTSVKVKRYISGIAQGIVKAVFLLHLHI